jgi:hypothetical protein
MRKEIDLKWFACCCSHHEGSREAPCYIIHDLSFFPIPLLLNLQNAHFLNGAIIHAILCFLGIVAQSCDLTDQVGCSISSKISSSRPTLSSMYECPNQYHHLLTNFTGPYLQVRMRHNSEL